MRDRKNQPLYFIAQVQDISDRKQTEATLREAERRWRSLLENVRLVVVGLDITGKVEFVNAFFLELTGYTEAEVLGKDWFETFLPQRTRQQVRTVFREVIEREDYPHYTNAILTKSGEERTIAWSNTRLQNLQGKAIGTTSIGEDITERRAVEKMKNEFISIVSHELRTPLTSIRGSLGILATGALDNHPERMRRMIEIAAIDTERLVRLVNDILDLDRLESGKITLVKECCDAGVLVEQAARGMRSLAEKEKITLSVSSVSTPVWASPDRIIQTLTNLLSNAIKFSSTHSMITIIVEPQGDRVLFQVKDRGRGIPADKLETIFERFQQVNSSDSRSKGGTGLGLAICHSIITQHGGQIWAESVLGEGSTFSFTLPVPPEFQ
jgi:PAS domain S-box-containing protein